ncbi:MAG: anthranilate phosphoribosyltransferase [Candidatus Marinimicrobia bacterium]|nr:anthranilate phosphoribosyltransferase [Candidatus Neomarinimicrobiota bacterium]MCF7904228.1 anthranilate phosphoribosyltransferase [Candidatus Neomarinimicrobiota bacterium]
MNLQDFVRKSISGQLELSQQESYLLELNQKGFTGQDVAKMVRLFYEQMPVKLDIPGAIDLCGTGGSGLKRINTSTLNALILSACGVAVAKHGNKAASGRYGSFDLLEDLGLNISPEKSELEAIYKNLGIAFIFARSFHPAFKHFAAVRQSVGVKTIFNILGPLLNPANPEYQIIGTSNSTDMELIAEACLALGKKHVLVLTGGDGLDELTLTRETQVREIIDGEILSYTLRPEDFGFDRVEFSEIEGGSKEFNLKLADDIIKGKCSSQHVNLVLINTALSLKFMGKVKTYRKGVELARETIQSGAAKRLLDSYGRLSNTPDILLDIVKNKRSEVEAQKKTLPLKTFKKDLKQSDRSFKQALAGKNTLGLIAEIKKGSPSQAEIYKGELEPGEIAQAYEDGGVNAISVLTEKNYFGGSLNNLKTAREATMNTPLLMKDFIIDSYQIYQARYYGADAILLIVAILTYDQIQEYIEISRSLGMDALVEVHSRAELEVALRAKAEIIGINNRNLHTMDVDTKTFIRLCADVPKDVVLIAESGYGFETISRINGVADAALVGTSIMQESNTVKALEKLRQGRKLFKACGIRNLEIALECEDLGVDMVGLNFVPSSKRRIETKKAKEITGKLKKTLSVGVFQNQALETVNVIAEEVGLDLVQLSGEEDEKYCKGVDRPVIKTLGSENVELAAKYDAVVSMFIVDGKKPGSGEGYDYSIINKTQIDKPFLVAGGVSESNTSEILALVQNASGVDAASGIESEGKEDMEKIVSILKHVKDG